MIRQPVEDLPGEEWRDIAGTAGKYQVSNMGRVKSFKRKPEALLKPLNNGDDYWQVNFKVDGKRRALLIHRLVMLAFSPIDNPDDLEVDHLDGNPANCALSNLEWTTTLENTRRAFKSGRPRDKSKSSGEASVLSKLTNADVLRIRRICEVGGRGIKIFLAREYGVNRGTIENIASGYTWKHLLPSK